MKILLISPTVDNSKRTNQGLMMPQLALYILQGLTPAEHEVQILDEEEEELILDESCDLVGISCMTANAPRSYQIAKKFRSLGKTVVMGGVHPTILPEEALKHCDSVVIGEAEGVWETLLEDFQNSNLQPTYHEPYPDLDRYVPKDFSKVLKKGYFKLVPIMTTRGCPYNCDFCCVTNLFGKKIRHISIENVVRDIKESGARNFMFLDDNIIGHPAYAKELFKAIMPLKIHWVGQASLSLVKDEEMMQLAADSGCRALFIGLESVSVEQLKTMRKTIKDIDDLEKALKKIKNMGILIHASMIFGFDNDNEDVFDDTVDFLIKNKVSTVSFNVLTPYPGTKTYDDLKEAGRLLTDDWRYYDHNTVVYQPTKMTPFQLQEGKTRARKRFYDFRSVMKRLTGNLYNPVVYLATNYGNIKQTRVEAERNKRLKGELFSDFHEHNLN
jgi:radical SAM superfamily enzyme YgiQ (UPF0313 family)